VHDNIQRYYEQFLPWTPQMLQENYQDLCDIIQSIKDRQDDKARDLAHRHVQRFSEYMGQ
jgi:DNA-binding GntR family transcriptional regulator